MAGKEGSTRRGEKGSSTRNGEEGGFSLVQCSTTGHTVAATGAGALFLLEQFTSGKHMTAEGAATGNKGNFSLVPCTAGKHMEAATGEKGTSSVEEHPLKGCPTKRKLPEEREALDMFPAQEEASIFGHWADPLPKLPTARTGNSKLVERVALEPMAVDLFSEDAELRKRVKAALLRFPESKALNSTELDDAIERIIKESKPDTASVAGPGMVRMSDDQIRIWLLVLKTPTVDDILGAEAGGVFPPGWIEKRRLQLEGECRHKTIGGPIIVVHKIRIDLITKGYVVFHKEYLRPDGDEESDEESEDEDEDDDEE